mmetsp:Transcript_73525/g.127562  ORF Transcript_73525/g.127562 Transcript_73525/m.127562 type:complete len:123 (+) Transcript_73525:693-1061(+)
MAMLLSALPALMVPREALPLARQAVVLSRHLPVGAQWEPQSFQSGASPAAKASLLVERASAAGMLYSPQQRQMIGVGALHAGQCGVALLGCLAASMAGQSEAEMVGCWVVLAPEQAAHSASE